MSQGSRLGISAAVAAVCAAAVLCSPVFAQINRPQAVPSAGTRMPAPALPARTAPAILDSSLAASAVRAPALTANSGPIVRGISVQGIAGEDSVRILRVFGVDVGTPLTAPVLREGLRRVWALDVMDDLWAEGKGSPAGDSTSLVLHVTARPRIQRMEFVGNKKIKSEELGKKTALVTGSRLSPVALFAALDSLKRAYREKGHVNTDVQAEERPSGKEQIDLIFNITEGPSAHVRHFAFEGTHAFTAAQLSHQMASKKAGFLKSGKLDPDKLDKDITKLTDFYRARGYRDVQVTRDSLRFSDSGQSITLVYHIDDGPRYKMGVVKMAGDKALSPGQKAAIGMPLPGGWYNGPAIKKAVEDTYAAYAENGYLYVAVDPQETVRDSNIVDATLQVQEGAPSHIRWVNITGNSRTKEKVVRREISVHEGDLFRRSALIRTQQDVFRLGFFQDVQVDFKPADSTDVDLYLKVVEKETGTASAGAGYSSEGGLTGFVQLGHNNLFGSGSSISIALERGARRNTYDVSYTDPWFRDSRTTFGFSLYNRSQVTSVTGSGTTLDYNDKRIGGSIRLGRPLRSIDRYLHGFVTYRLENVNIEVDSTVGLTAAQIELEKLIQQGKTTTSSMEFTFSRDNTINPFYPTGGMRVSESNEFAGRLLGGDVNYYKFEIDARDYFRSVFRPFTSMIRARTGLVGNYGSDVPQYERYRLGGTTFYGLRGYEDYEIVPEENIHDVPDSAAIKDTSGAITGYRHFTTQVRYPGGRVFAIATFEQQFPIVHPVHGLLFAEAGNTWNDPHEMTFHGIKKAAGVGFRIEVPLLGNMGLDFGYGFDKSPRPGWRTHFLLGNMFF